MFGLHLVSVAVGVVVAQFLPSTVGAFIVAKVKAARAAAAPVVAKVEAEVKKSV
jgi:hypothetical protein